MSVCLHEQSPAANLATLNIALTYSFEYTNLLIKTLSSSKILLFVGHISLVFLIAYLVSTKFQGIKKTVSIALVMFLSILPDIDLVFRLAGIDLGHRTFTHSAIIWLIIAGILITFFTIKYRKGSVAAIYLIAYLSHLMVADIVVGPINVLYPLGDFIVNSPIKGGSLPDILLETLLFTFMANIVMTRYYSRREMRIFFYSDTIVKWIHSYTLF